MTGTSGGSQVSSDPARQVKQQATLAAAAAVTVAASAATATEASAGTNASSSKAAGLGQTTGLLPRNHLTLESAIQAGLSKEPVRLPLYPGVAPGRKRGPCCWTPPTPGWHTTWA